MRTALFAILATFTATEARAQSVIVIPEPQFQAAEPGYSGVAELPIAPPPLHIDPSGTALAPEAVPIEPVFDTTGIGATDGQPMLQAEPPQPASRDAGRIAETDRASPAPVFGETSPDEDGASELYRAHLEQQRKSGPSIRIDDEVVEEYAEREEPDLFRGGRARI